MNKVTKLALFIIVNAILCFTLVVLVEVNVLQDNGVDLFMEVVPIIYIVLNMCIYYKLIKKQKAAVILLQSLLSVIAYVFGISILLFTWFFEGYRIVMINSEDYGDLFGSVLIVVIYGGAFILSVILTTIAEMIKNIIKCTTR